MPQHQADHEEDCQDPRNEKQGAEIPRTGGLHGRDSPWCVGWPEVRPSRV